MRYLKLLTLIVITVALMNAGPVAPAAQISVGIGVAPVCPYGYFDYAPYDCAPYGYYGPDWFVGGVFLGAGPWFHGPHGFYGHVDNRYDPQSMAITGQCRLAGHSRSSTSSPMKHATARATQATPTTLLLQSTAADIRELATLVEVADTLVVEAVTTRPHGSNSPPQPIHRVPHISPLRCGVFVAPSQHWLR